MKVRQTLRTSVYTSPTLMRRLNGWLTIFWIVMIPVSILTGWINSIAYVSALSLWALVASHWSAWQASRVEVEQERELEEQIENPPEERVVERLVEETTLERSSAGVYGPPAAGSRAGGHPRVQEDP